MSKIRTFDVDDEKDTQGLVALIDPLLKVNESDEIVIKELQASYDSSCWFSVISFAEQYIYG